MFRACLQENVEKVVFASSGCIYPNYIQSDPRKFCTSPKTRPDLPTMRTIFTAGQADGGDDAAGVSPRLRPEGGIVPIFHRLRSARSRESRRDRMIARAFVAQNPFIVWGNGEQIRNWTHVDDIVSAPFVPPK